jgi:hypothetical protein
MNAVDRIRRAAQAVAKAVGSHDHIGYLEIVAVVLYADESVNNLDEWGAIVDVEFKSAATEGAEDIRERITRRHSPAVRVMKARPHTAIPARSANYAR